MKRFLRPTTGFGLAALALASAVSLPYLPAAAAANSKNIPGRPAVVRGKEKKPEVLKGDAVKLRVKQLRAKSKGFNRALKAMERLGKRPIWEASALLINEESASAGAARARVKPASYAQDTISDGNGGEMIFVTFEGDESFWDGTVYVHDAYQEGTYNVVMEDYNSQDSAAWTVLDEVYYPPDGGEPIREQPCSAGSQCLPMMEAPVARQNVRPEWDAAAGLQGLMLKASYAPAAKPLASPAYSRSWFSGWWGCTRTGCTQSVGTGCIGSSTFRRLFVCAAIRCTAIAISCV